MPRLRRLDIAAVVFALVLPSVLTWLYFIVLQNTLSSVQQGVYTAGKVVQFGFPVFWVVAIQRARLRLKFPGRAGIIEGALFGAAVFALMLLTYFGWLKPSGSFGAPGEAICRRVASFGVDRPLPFLTLAVFYSLIHSFFEEYYYRWFVFGQLQRFVPVAVAILISSLGFMGHHVIILGHYFGYDSWITPVFALAIAVGGAVWAWIYYRSGSLLGPWISHFFVDAAIFAIGYNVVSGTFAGP